MRVDVVLNSLSGDFIPASLSVLAPGGFFLEIGKRGIWSAEEMALQRPDVHYHCYDVGELSVREPEVMRGLLETMQRRLEDGSLAPLPRTDFGFEDAPRAFRYMAQARHIGKIVLNRRAAAGFGGSWLISGGLGALGLRVADWLAKQGAREIVLAGRGAGESIRESGGVRVRTVRVDIADRAAVRELVDSIEDLRGVVHAAGVLDDGMLDRQTPERFARVFAPKVTGAWNLHEATLGRSLEHFVMFSSIAGVLGGPGQGSYAAANSFLDGLAHYRRSLGLPALSIDWGPWADGGMASEQDDAHRRRLRTNGIGTIEPRQGLKALGELLQDRAAQAVVLPVDWEAMLRQFPADARPTVFARFGNTRARSEDAVGAPGGHLLPAVQAAGPAQRRSVLVSLLRREIARVLALEPNATIGLSQPLSEIGLDSLMAVELRIALANGFGLTLASTTLFDYPRLDALAAHIESQLFPTEAAPEVVSEVPDEFGDLLDAIETLGDAQVHEMLAAKA
jgi:acyl carrier protein